jgi:hypothetical protein
MNPLFGAIVTVAVPSQITVWVAGETVPPAFDWP